MAKSKNGAVTTTKNGVNVDAVNMKVVEHLTACLNLEGEFKVYLEIDKLNAEGMLSINGIKATLKEVEKVGSAPSLKSDYAQQFPIVRELRKMKGAENKTLKELFNIAVQGRKSFGTGEVMGKVANAVTAKKSIETFKKSIPSQGERAKKRGAGKQTADEKKGQKNEVQKATPEQLVGAVIKALDKGHEFAPELLDELQDALFKYAERAEVAA